MQEEQIKLVALGLVSMFSCMLLPGTKALWDWSSSSWRLGEMASRMVLATSRLSVLETEMGRSLSVVKDSSWGRRRGASG